MGYIHLRDRALTERASRLAERLGVSEEDAIGTALAVYEASLDQTNEVNPQRQPMLEWLLEYRRLHPLPPPTGFVADKAFYDSLNDEDDD